jgi:hypothetical protein
MLELLRLLEMLEFLELYNAVQCVQCCTMFCNAVQISPGQQFGVLNVPDLIVKMASFLSLTI